MNPMIFHKATGGSFGGSGVHLMELQSESYFHDNGTVSIIVILTEVVEVFRSFTEQPQFNIFLTVYQ